MTRVRDMPRQQQKAVFARMTDDGYLSKLEGAEKASQRRAYLIKRNELSETYEDRIFNVYNNSRLTHRQKMARIAGLKKDATKKLNKYQAEQSGSIVEEMREENLRKFKKEYDIKEVLVSSKKKTLKEISKAPLKKIIEQRLVIEKKKEVETREELRQASTNLGESIMALKKASPVEFQDANKRVREATKKINRKRKKLVLTKRKIKELETALVKERKKKT